MGMLDVFIAMKNENGLGRLMSLLSFVVLLMESCKDQTEHKAEPSWCWLPHVEAKAGHYNP